MDDKKNISYFCILFFVLVFVSAIHLKAQDLTQNLFQNRSQSSPGSEIQNQTQNQNQFQNQNQTQNQSQDQNQSPSLNQHSNKDQNKDSNKDQKSQQQTDLSVNVDKSLSKSEVSNRVYKKVKFQGRALEKGTQIPLKNIAVYLLPAKLKTMTDSAGYFEFSELNVDDLIEKTNPTDLSEKQTEITWIINLSGYEKLEQTEFVNFQNTNSQTEPKKITRTLFVEKSDYLSFETLVTGTKNKKDTSVKTLDRSQFLQMPGAQGDPVKAVQNLPGVNRSQGFSAQVIVQGSAPQDTKYDIDGHEVPLVFHFGGLTSVVLPEAVEQVDYFSAGYDADNSRAMGGIISLKTKDPEVSERDKRSMFFVDTMKAGGLLETKLSPDSSLSVGGRYSYIGLILGAALKNNERLNLTVAPEFSDLLAIYRKKINDTEKWKLVFVGSRDRMEFLFKEPVKEDPTIRGQFRNETNFFRLIPQWEKQLEDSQILKLSAGIGKDYFLVDIGDRFFHSDIFLMTVRGDYEKRWTSEWKTNLGFDNQYYDALIDVNLPIARNEGGVSNPVSTLQMKQVSVRSRITNTGGYYKTEWSPDGSSWTLLPALRWDYFKSLKEHFLLPRMGARYKWDNSLNFKLGSGIYVQPPAPQEVDSEFGNPAVKSPRAYQWMMGFEKDFRQGQSEGTVLGINYFDKWFDRLVIESRSYVNRDGVVVPEVYNNEGRGRALGLELSLKNYFTDSFSSLLSYTISRSTRWNPNQSEYVFQYDQTHNLNWILAKDIKSGSWKNWRWSSRYRYVTGNPNTPVIDASFDADNDVYLPKRGVLYSERLNNFSQLDIRLDKKWILPTEVWTAYFDIQNILNSKNSESVRYAYDYSKKVDITGLPMFFALGMKGEF